MQATQHLQKSRAFHYVKNPRLLNGNNPICGNFNSSMYASVTAWDTCFQLY